MPEPEIELEREYTVPLSRAWIAPRHRRVVRAVNVLREFAERHMKSEEVKIESELNETLWERGITKPPRRITVKMTKDEDGLVTISLPKKVEEEKKEEEVEPKSEEIAPQAEPKIVPKDEEKEAKRLQTEAPLGEKPKAKPSKKASVKKKRSKKASGEKKKSSKKPKSAKKK